MELFISFFVSRIPEFFSCLSDMVIVAGVSLSGFLAALIIIGILIKNFLYTAR